jgi:3'-phosphoadenosine 5'-phosphosulfate (PAPS) 3'-phosphatase
MDSMVKYAVLARGDANLYLRFPRGGYEEKVWDHAAGVALLEAAGGCVTDGSGKPLKFLRSSLYLEGVTSIVASSSPSAHSIVLDALSPPKE